MLILFNKSVSEVKKKNEKESGILISQSVCKLGLYGELTQVRIFPVYYTTLRAFSLPKYFNKVDGQVKLTDS